MREMLQTYDEEVARLKTGGKVSSKFREQTEEMERSVMGLVELAGRENERAARAVRESWGRTNAVGKRRLLQRSVRARVHSALLIPVVGVARWASRALRKMG